jgi:hypothetical protein
MVRRWMKAPLLKALEVNGVLFAVSIVLRQG